MTTTPKKLSEDASETLECWDCGELCRGDAYAYHNADHTFAKVTIIHGHRLKELQALEEEAGEKKRLAEKLQTALDRHYSDSAECSDLYYDLRHVVESVISKLKEADKT
jgi:hypothetical protein